MDATTATKLPPAKEIRDVLSDLMGRNVAVKTIGPWAPKPQEMGAAAEYADDRRQLRVAALFDFPLSVFAGAALSLLPGGQAQEMVKEHKGAEAVLDTVNEVLNILASVYNTEGSTHVKLSKTHSPGRLLPREVAQILMRRNGRLDLEITIQGYGKGRAAFVLA